VENWPLNPVDTVVAAILLLSAGFAFFQGFVREALSIASWLGAAVTAIYAFPLLQPAARATIENPMLADALTGGGTFRAALLLFSLIGRAISDRVRLSRVGAVDRSLGFLFGLVRGGVILCIAYLGVMLALPREDRPVWLIEARSTPLLDWGSDMLLKILAPDQRWKFVPAGRPETSPGEAVHRLVPPTAPGGLGGDEPGETGYKTEQRHALDNLFRGQEPAE
jgi:membrane protein required for colicin V production